MSTAVRPLFAFQQDTYARAIPELSEPWQAAAVPSPELLVLNDALAAELGAEPTDLRSADGIAVLAGNVVPEGAVPTAQAYAGHQFGGFSPRLGDGRALLLGEVLDTAGRRRDVHFKGSGRTPFARGGDGKAAVGPMLREYVVAEAMHALGIPTTRALAVVATGEPVVRETVLPGAVLTRVAASHLRVGTFEYAARLGGGELVHRLADYAIARHHPHAADAEEPHLALFDAVVDAQAALVAQWMLVGFIHGVMNTDNMTISGETIDYGPCAFMDAYDPATVFSSIDHGGRYAYGNQPPIAQWNLARLAETLLPLLADDTEAAVAKATAVLETFPTRFRARWAAGLQVKLGLLDAPQHDEALLDDLLTLLHEQRVDFTSAFRALAEALRGDRTRAHGLVDDVPRLDAWIDRWVAALADQDRDVREAADAMDAINPMYVPRNHLVDEALTAATAGDLDPLHRLLAVLAHPFDERPGLEAYTVPADQSFGATFQTFCGT